MSEQDTTTPSGPSTLDELPDRARQQDAERLAKEKEAEEQHEISTMEALTAGQDPIGDRTRLKIEREQDVSLPPSALESLLRIATSPPHHHSVPDPDDAPPRKPGDPSTRAPRMRLKEEEARREGPAILESLLTFTHPSGLGKAAAEERRASSLEGLLGIRGGGAMSPERKRAPSGSSMSAANLSAGGSMMRLREKSIIARQVMVDDLSRIVGDHRLPRARLPRRTTRGDPPPPDGFTPIAPMPVAVHCALAEHQRCPGRKRPVPVGERTHHRLEFRYNRFELLEVCQVLYTCPDVEELEPFAGADPAFFCQQAPLGNGFLAMLILAHVRDAMPLSRIELLLSQLGAPLADAVLTTQLNDAADALLPVVAQMRGEMAEPTPEAPVPVLCMGLKRDTAGQMQVHTGNNNVVLEYQEGGTSGPIEGEAIIGARLRDLARAKGRAHRWGQLRQKFLYALVTDNTLARRGLRLLDLLPALPDPDTDKAPLARLKRWLDGCYAGFEVPKSRLEHAITSGISMWPLLMEEGSAVPRARLSNTEWAFTPEGIAPHRMACLHSLLETCAVQRISPWDYLNDLLGQVAVPAALSAKDWTPAAWKTRCG